MGTDSSIPPDTKDWTWVLSRPCGECGADVGAVDPASIAQALRHNASAWRTVLAGDDVGARPAADVWSPLEYACHVRDVHRVFDERVRLILEQADPLFANWDQDAAAAGYGDQAATEVADELSGAAAAVAKRYEGVAEPDWSRPGRRSNGSAFTLATLAQYHLHDVLHHLWDVGTRADGSPGTMAAHRQGRRSVGTDSSIPPDTKEWTWVLTRPCGECGADVGAVDPVSIAQALRHNASAWRTVLAGDDVAERPTPGVWSPLEYACHVRDVHVVFDQRLRSMLEQDDPLFANWDQDAAAAGYGDQPATGVADALVAAAADVASRYEGVTPQQWDRPGRRSNGSVFTVATQARIHLHDVVHHLWDVRGGADGEPA